MDVSKPFFKIKKFREDAVIPSKRKEDAGYDLYGCFEDKFKVLKTGEIWLCPTGIGCEIPEDWVLFLNERGSTGTKGISKRAGIIDSGFRGEIFVCLNNTSNKDIIFAKSDGAGLAVFCEENNINESKVTIYPQSKAIAQGLLFWCPHVEVLEVSELSNNSERGTGVIGSSKK
mgnify:CR=1 FL=1